MPEAATPSPCRERGASRRTAKRIFVALLFVLVIGGGYVAGGFLRFAQEVASFARLSGNEHADGIVVLTGGALRLDQAIGLLKDGKARRLLISGVNPSTSATTLSKLTDTDRRLFDCCVDLDYAALNTIGNAEMAERWAQAQGFDELILVTSDYHMPRTLLEFKRFGNVPVIKPYPVVRPDLWAGDSTMPSGKGVKVLLLEYAKLLATRLRAATGMEGPAAVSEAVTLAGRNS